MLNWSDRIGFSFKWMWALGGATIDWEINSSLVRVTRLGTPLHKTLRRKRLVIKQIGARSPERDASFPIADQSAYYRMDVSIRDEESASHVRYAEYFRVVEPKFDVRLALKRDVLRSGDVAVMRVENFGTVPVDYKYQFAIERYENGTWILDPATPENFITPIFSVGAGLSRGCEIAPLPAGPGQYRIVKDVDPSPGVGPKRRITKEFWVVK